MTYHEKLKGLVSSEVRTFVKENLENESFLNEVESNEDFLKFILSHKAGSDILFSLFLSNINDATKLVSSLIESGFVPSLMVIEKIIDLGNSADQLLCSVIESFPSVVIDSALFLRTVNEGFVVSSEVLVLKNPKFQHTDVFLLISVNKNLNPDLIELIAGNETIRKLVLENVTGHSSQIDLYSHSLVNKIIEKSPEYAYGSSDITLLSKLQLSKKALDSFFQAYTPAHNKSSETIQIEWNQEIEQIDPSYFRKNQKKDQIIIVNAPTGSKYRPMFLLRSPRDASVEELLELVSNYKSNEAVARECLRRPLSVIKNIPNLSEYISEELGPKDLSNTLGEDDIEKNLYLLDLLPSKYSPALRSIIPVALAAKVAGKNKKSYFNEIFQAIEEKNIVEFNEALSHGYSLAQFSEDSKQKSKQTMCENLSVDSDFIKELTQKQLIDLCQSHLRIHVYDLDGFNLALTPEDCLQLTDKIKLHTSFSKCIDQVSLLNHLSVDSEDLSSIFSSHQSVILTNKNLLATFLKRIKNTSKKINLEHSELESVCPFLNKKVILSKIELDERELMLSINLKDEAGDYLYSKDDIVEILIKHIKFTENESFLGLLLIRDEEFALALNKAYLKGTKELTELLKSPVKISRKKENVQMHERFKSSLSQDPKALVDSIFNRGGALSLFELEIFNYGDSLNKFHDNRPVLIESITASNLFSLLKDMNKVKFNVSELEFNDYDEQNFKEFEDRLVISKLSVIETDELDGNFFQFVKVNKPVFNFLILINMEKVDLKVSVLLLKSGIDFEFKNQMIGNLKSLLLEHIEQFKTKDVSILEDHGLIFDKEVMTAIILECSSSSEVLRWACSRTGSLAIYKINEDSLDSLDASELEEIKSTGITILSEENYDVFEKQQELAKQGPNFEEMPIDSLSVTAKSDLIKFIETEIDPNYSKLNLRKSNLGSLEVLLPYKDMISFDSFSEKDIFDVLSISPNIQTNKKIIKNLKELLALKGASFLLKVKNVKEVSLIFNKNIEYSLSDFIDYTNVDVIAVSEYFDEINSESVSILLNHKEACGFILKNKDRQSIFRFLRTASAHDPQYMKDICELMDTIPRGLQALKDRERTNISPEEKLGLDKSIANIESHLVNVSLIDDAEMMHDKLVTLASFIKGDPLQPLGQDKYTKLEKSQKASDQMGVKLYFPKTRGELQMLGDTHGWCVSNTPSYGDNVIGNGNILVALSPAESHGLLEDVIALAHFVRERDGGYHIEQLKWSEKVKGSRNIEAIRDFNHQEILSQILSHLDSYKGE